MKLQNTLSVIPLFLTITIRLPLVHADGWNQTTRFTFSQPVQIPGRVLPAGTYRFQLAENDSRHLVQIFREDRTLVTTLYSVPRLQDGRNADPAITLANRGAAQPQTTVAWFFAVEKQGHELLYPRQENQELARATQTTFMSGK
jgi:Protein of unknown function (DUF2911)